MYLKVLEVAKQLKISTAIVYGWVSKGLLACHRLGAKGKRGCIRIAESDLAAFLAGSRKEKKPEAKPPAPKPAKSKSIFRHIHIG
jgi:excisionase family DNA binding protein